MAIANKEVLIYGCILEITEAYSVIANHDLIVGSVASCKTDALVSAKFYSLYV